MKPRQTAVSLFALLVATMPAMAQTPPRSDAPVLMTAEHISHDQDAQQVTAVGRVEISQSGRVMLAERVVYDLRQDRIFAAGDVAILEPTGEVLFAEQAEITGDLKSGVAENIRLLLTDQSRLAAAVARRSGGEVTELERAVYSPCLPCRDKPESELLWQLKAQEVRHDQISKDIEYKDVWLEMFGVPVAYTPYLSHPDPTVDRRSGFLAPSFSAGRNLGATVEIPYHYVLSPSHDLTFAPKITEREGLVVAGEHRKRFTFGEMVTSGSITYDSNDEVRGHLFAEGEFHLNEHWRAGYDIERTTDDTYLRRYKYALQSKPYLTTRAYAEGFGARSYALVESYAFQDQLAGQDNDKIPFVAPLMQYSYVGQPNAYGGHWTLDANAVSLTRPEGADSQRVAVRPAFVVPYTSPGGQIVTTSLAMQVLGYRYDDAAGRDPSGGSGRVLPELSVEWRYPFISMGQRVSHVIEPIVLGVASPFWSSSGLPNEDSLDFQFSDANLFQLSRFAGLDRQEVGPRVSYGLQYSAILPGGGYYSVLLGQSWRMTEDDDLPTGSGLDDNMSDIVGRVIASPSQNLDLYYRFRLDKEDLQSRQQELTALVGPPLLRVVADYTLVRNANMAGEESDQEQVLLGLQSALSENWRVRFFTRHSLAGEEGLLDNGAALVYEDECLAVTTSYTNSRTSDRDLEPGHSLMLQVNFKTLGAVPISVF